MYCSEVRNSHKNYEKKNVRIKKIFPSLETEKRSEHDREKTPEEGSQDGLPEQPTERRTTHIRDLADLKRLGVQTTRATGFLMLRGRALEAHRWTEQLGFWNVGAEVGARQQIYDVSPGTFR